MIRLDFGTRNMKYACMHITCITIFPEIFKPFFTSSLLGKAVEKGILEFDTINPRDFCRDRQKKVDDEIYGGGVGLLMKAQPVIDSIRYAVKELETTNYKPQLSEVWSLKSEVKNLKSEVCRMKLIMVWPSKTVFNQQIAHDLSVYDHLIFICGRYEGIDHRVNLRCEREFCQDFWSFQDQKSCETTFCELSLGQFVTLWGELPAMTMIEAITRLIPGVIKEEISRQDESYRPEQDMQNIEYPQYTRPEIVEWFAVPEVLLSGHHKKIQEWKQEMTGSI